MPPNEPEELNCTAPDSPPGEPPPPAALLQSLPVISTNNGVTEPASKVVGGEPQELMTWASCARACGSRPSSSNAASSNRFIGKPCRSDPWSIAGYCQEPSF